MSSQAAQNPLHERYASRDMARIFSRDHRYATWRRLWIVLADCQRQLGLPITVEQIATLEGAATDIDFERVAELERATRHDVVAHLRHFAEQTGDAGKILHLGATSAFVTDNTDVLLLREALDIVRSRLLGVIARLADFAEETKDLPTLAYTHLQPAQLTTVGKRACLWIQDFVADLEEVDRRRERLLCRGVKGTTGTQASYLSLFNGDHDKVRELDRRVAEALGFAGSYPLTGQTYSRKQDSRILATLAGVAESSHKLGTDLRLLQGLGELAEPFEDDQVGSSAMAYKRNPIRAERMCSLSRRLITDALNGPLTHSTQWLERSLDDSANRRLVLPDSFLTADAALLLAADVAGRLTVRRAAIETNVRRQLPFMATEDLLMTATTRGGSRQDLHETIRRYSLEAYELVERGEENPLVQQILDDPAFGLTRGDVDTVLDAARYTGRSARQVEEYLSEAVVPLLGDGEPSDLEAPRV